MRALGRGGAAVVFLALQESLDRQVAVKVLRRDVEDPKVWREFRREAPRSLDSRRILMF